MGPSVSVRCRLLLAVAIVTHLVTRLLAGGIAFVRSWQPHDLDAPAGPLACCFMGTSTRAADGSIYSVPPSCCTLLNRLDSPGRVQGTTSGPGPVGGKWNHVLPKSVTSVLGNPIGFVVTITYYGAASSSTETFVLA